MAELLGFWPSEAKRWRMFELFKKRYSTLQQIGAMSIPEIPEKEVLIEEIPHQLLIVENKPFSMP